MTRRMPIATLIEDLERSDVPESVIAPIRLWLDTEAPCSTYGAKHVFVVLAGQGVDDGRRYAQRCDCGATEHL